MSSITLYRKIVTTEWERYTIDEDELRGDGDTVPAALREAIVPLLDLTEDEPEAERFGIIAIPLTDEIGSALYELEDWKSQEIMSDEIVAADFERNRY